MEYDDLMNLHLPELHELLEKKKLEVKMQAAARTLQRCYRVYAFKKFCFQSRMRKEQCARKLQKQWKVHRQRQFRDGIANHGRYKACVKIQKYLKGLIVAKKFEPKIIKLRMLDHFDHFD